MSNSQQEQMKRIVARYEKIVSLHDRIIDHDCELDLDARMDELLLEQMGMRNHEKELNDMNNDQNYAYAPL